jgi:SAM-dependent methyltransferase
MEDPFSKENIKEKMLRLDAQINHQDFEWLKYLDKRNNAFFNKEEFNDHERLRYWFMRMHLLIPLLSSVEKAFNRKIEATTLTGIIKEKPLKGLKILELGFGNPSERDFRALFNLVELGAKTYGIEINQRGVNSAKERAREEPIPEEFRDADGNPLITESQIRQGDIGNLSEIFSDIQFDVVCSDAVFARNPLAGTPEHMDDENFLQAKAIKWLTETAKVLKPGGLAVHTNLSYDPYFPEVEAIEKCGFKILVLCRPVEDPENRQSVGGNYSVFMKVGK